MYLTQSNYIRNVQYAPKNTVHPMLQSAIRMYFYNRMM